MPERIGCISGVREQIGRIPYEDNDEVKVSVAYNSLVLITFTELQHSSRRIQNDLKFTLKYDTQFQCIF